ncbi:unnamed protein product [Urochloa humidicola]
MDAGGIIDGPTTQEIMVPAAIHDASLARTTARLQDIFFDYKKMYRFPRDLRGIGGDRHGAPSVVAIGPYHHGAPELERMEEIKLAACAADRAAPPLKCTRRCSPSENASATTVSRVTAISFVRGCYVIRATCKRRQRLTLP